MAENRDDLQTVKIVGTEEEATIAVGFLQAQGIDVEEPEIAPWGAKQLYVRDPDGYQLCFQWRAG